MQREGGTILQEHAQTPKSSTRRLATVSLIFMAVGFIASLPFKENDWSFGCKADLKPVWSAESPIGSPSRRCSVIRSD